MTVLLLCLFETKLPSDLARPSGWRWKVLACYCSSEIGPHICDTSTRDSCNIQSYMTHPLLSYFHPLHPLFFFSLRLSPLLSLPTLATFSEFLLSTTYYSLLSLSVFFVISQPFAILCFSSCLFLHLCLSLLLSFSFLLSFVVFFFFFLPPHTPP